MKVVILCGGKGTRMREETEYRPKPLVLAGGKPILWHIMKLYSYYGMNDFILCVGYKGDMIKQYFMEMYWRNNDFTLHINGDKYIEYHTKEEENWNITIVDTGLETLTAGRLKQVEKYIDEDIFMFTYGDGLSNVNLNELLKYHKSKNRIATLTGVHPISTFGLIDVENGIVKSFREKPMLKDMINGGYMVLNKKIFDYLPEQDCMFEKNPLRKLAYDSQLAVYEHNGFWKAVDTFKDVETVNKMCAKGVIPWKIWK
ncbi:glucose-1-phosphate cytidylyltransferase [Clostridium sporogenes]|uniref:Glucose-1-phosphate cytidylyltransferase n=1 Tax=Clostridium sporogenes TaxID=1509 RepID=A0A7X5P762_CLOSG|nr:glucose-1-phosphate cytidylyltransferase [Clostridium sporogenes]AJD30110.1 glucose-1-phosphate cytidylyltransferase [Clostridium botulinum Prevot_594]NFQ15401.1 glucose-1-phosphate cytidylyltransferase [Clostridium sporogenes]NFQ19424.1 glucose-1-phosphate cytidylyltransferase [Clostridium sporogenes]NFQ27944.1 glucose-1-phosphate cytidylyltransferase [Clostridium sporogenes]NFR60129.1 glucose-1-phosphate cytidylyltransferase [Clostridium sporogenes]